MTTNAQAALIAAASTMTPTNGDWHAEYGCKLIEARAQHFLTWLDAADKQPAPVVVPSDDQAMVANPGQDLEPVMLELRCTYDDGVSHCILRAGHGGRHI